MTDFPYEITRALISFPTRRDRGFARALEKQGVDIISTRYRGVTAQKRRPVREISSFTGYPESVGRARENFASARARRIALQTGHPKHEKEAREQGFEPIDLSWSISIPSSRQSRNLM